MKSDSENGNFATDGKFYVVDLECGNRIVVKKSWVENANSKKSRIFFSPNLEATPLFVVPKYYFRENKADCYVGQVVRMYGKFFLS